MPDWDLKIVDGSTSKFFRLASQNGQKQYQVEPAFEGSIDATYAMDDWSYGVGMLRPPSAAHLTNRTIDHLGHVLRLADGYGIDLSEKGVVKHGPGIERQRSMTGTFVDSITFEDKVWFLTTTNLYRYSGTTLTNHGSISGGLQLEVWQDKLLIAQGASGYSYTDTASGITAVTAIDAYRFAGVQSEDGPLIWIQTDANRNIQTTADPITASPSMATAVTVGTGGPITNLFVQAGYLLTMTEDNIYIIVGANSGSAEAVEFDRRFRRRKSSSAFSIGDSTGLETWVSDGDDIYRIETLGQAEFAARQAGPFYDDDIVPFSNPTTRGTVVDISIDFDAVYVTVQRGSDTYVYKGVEKLQGVYSWSPLIKESSVTSAGGRVHKRLADSEGHLYTLQSGLFNEYILRDWIVFNTDWQFETPYFIGQDENEVKAWNRFKAFVEVSSGSGTVQAAGRTDGTPTYVNIGSGMGDGYTTANPTALQHRRVQLRFTMSGNSSTESVDLRSFTLEGQRLPELKRLLTATVIVQNTGERDFLYSLRSGSFTIRDRLGTNTRDFTLLPDYPKQLELFDEITKEPQMAMQIRAVELLT